MSGSGIASGAGGRYLSELCGRSWLYSQGSARSALRLEQRVEELDVEVLVAQLATLTVPTVCGIYARSAL